MKTASKFFNYISITVPGDMKPVPGEKTRDIIMEAVKVYEHTLIGGTTFAINGDKNAMISMLAFKDHSVFMMYTRATDKPVAIVTSAPLDSLAEYGQYLETIGLKEDDVRELEFEEELEGIKTATLILQGEEET